MAKILGFTLIVVIYIITGCAPRNNQEQSANEAQLPGNYNFTGKISISGAYALSPLARALADGYTAKNPGVEFEIETTGTGAGIDAFSNGAIHLAMVSRPLTDEERSEGFFPVPIAKDAVVLIINRGNPWLQTILEKGLDPKILAQLYSSDSPMTWGDLLGISNGDKVNVFTRGDVSGAASLWAAFLFETQDNLNGTKVVGDAEMIEKVQADKFAIGYCNLNYAYDNVSRERKENIQVVPIDLNYNRKISSIDQPYETLEKIHRSIYLGLYPHALCRKLCLVSDGRPADPLLLDFLRWTLTEGQAVVSPTGYCEFNNAEKKVALEILQ